MKMMLLIASLVLVACATPKVKQQEDNPDEDNSKGATHAFAALEPTILMEKTNSEK